VDTLSVHIVRLDAMRVASTYGFGDSPEQEAWARMEAWASRMGFLDNPEAHPLFGFNNPYPTPEHPRYGYEYWMKVDPGVEPEGDVRIGEFFGGLYAVARCEALGHPESAIPSAWRALAEWCIANDHPRGTHVALEGFISSPDDAANLVMDLYCPIAR